MRRNTPKTTTLDASGVRFLCVVRLSDRVLVGHYCHNHAHQPTLEKEIESKISQVLVANAAQIHPRLSVADKDIGTIHYETDRYAMYLAVTMADYPQRTAFRCLADLRERFSTAFGDALHKAEQNGLSKAAKPLMVELCTKYADAASVDKTLGLIREVDGVKGIVSETVQHLLSTHENLEVLEDRSEALKAQTQTFHKSSRAVKVVTRKKNSKMRRVICALVLFGAAAAATPYVIQHWDEISAWFASMFPPTEEGSGEGSGEWGSGEWGSGYNATRPSSDRGGGGPVWEWRWPWS